MDVLTDVTGQGALQGHGVAVVWNVRVGGGG